LINLMRTVHKHKGFSLTEVLLSVATLAMGMMFIAGVFPVGIHFATISAERTVSAVVADEAFAKIRLYGIDVSGLPDSMTLPRSVDFYNVSPLSLITDWEKRIDEFAYPSTPVPLREKRYYWSAVCRSAGQYDSLVQVTVFVSRVTTTGRRYWVRDLADNSLILGGSLYPRPVCVLVDGGGDKLVIEDINPGDGIDEKTFINDGCTIVDDETGQCYRVLQRYSAPNDNTILLDRNWEGGDLPGWVWVIPPAIDGGKGPCIAVYQKEIRF